MGKKSKAASVRAKNKKIDPSELPTDKPPPLEAEIGSLKLLDKPQTPGSIRKVLGADGYDDGGVGDLRLAIDLEDYVLRRKRGENEYFRSLKMDLIPRIKEGNWKRLSRKEQKIELAKMLFHEEGDEEIIQGDPYKSVEVYSERAEELDADTKKKYLSLLRAAKYALECAIVLREPACVALCLSKVCERYLQVFGKEGAEDAIRCGKKAIAICLEDYYDIDDVAVEVEDKPKPSTHEKDPTYPGLSNPAWKEFIPPRVASICLRSAYLHCGNALAALGKDAEAREMYLAGFPIVDAEVRASRVDWERASYLINIGNSYSREGNFDKADEYFKQCEKLGDEQIGNDCKSDGMGIKLVALRARAFALNRNGMKDQGKEVLREVLRQQPLVAEETAKWRKEMLEADAMNQTEALEKQKQEAEAAAGGTASQSPAIEAK
uniref:Uncharacterized protein n=1 Tax=Amphora coffeiformis TaxID=265554 RepID=A0A7S3PC96_9STRA|mmetsp:Transcript_12761/g.24520  ORF Transcript_12761/g.24520 Transcript_12761/m.24520 type:complete len:435 (+) Transcript_12761:139-1443(+)